jgi:hypothetical protein
VSFPKRLFVLGLAVALAALAGCGDPPSPFEHQTPFANPLLHPGLRAGVIVAPVAMPRGNEVPGDVLTDAVVLALRDAEIPALTESEAAPAGGAVPRAVLRGEIAPSASPAGNGPFRLTWRLIAPDGHEATRFISEPRATSADWQSLSAALRAAVAADAVRGIERYVDDAEGLPPEAAALPKVTIVGVDGVPGAGPQAMARALEYHLKQAGLTVSDTIADDGAIIMGTIEVKPAAPRANPPGGQPLDNLRISWTVLRPDGREIGVISQANDVPRNALAGAWGDLAFLIAEAATPGIVDLLQQAAQAEAEAAAKTGKPVTP